jgi:four helix bundle protein
MTGYRFDFERMDVYRLAVEVARWFRQVRWEEGRHKLRDQGIRAMDSAVLNFAEGRMRGGKAGKNHYRIAHGSAGEALAVLDIVELPDGPSQQEKLRRIGVMLARMR